MRHVAIRQDDESNSMSEDDKGGRGSGPRPGRPRSDGKQRGDGRSGNPRRDGGRQAADKAAASRGPRRSEGKPQWKDRGAGKAEGDAQGRSSAPGRSRASGKPFTPKSRGMLSHGEAKAEGDKRGKPKSYGRLKHDEKPGERRPRPVGDDDRKRGGDRPRKDGGRSAPAPKVLEEAGIAGETMRIARRLARAGVASRRDAEAMIAEGRVAVNGAVLDSPALDVGPKDRITVDGEALPAMERTRLWLFHKPAGLVTTNRDPEGRPTVFERLPKDMPRSLAVGRLDINTEGLLLLTNDGGLARVLELPATGWLRRYRVRAHGSVDQAQLDELRNGVAIDGVFYGAIEASLDRVQGTNVWLTLGLREGKNREVKRVLGHLGLDVNRLIRLSYGPFQLADLAEGAVREIHGKTLRDQLGPRLIEEAGADFDAPILNPFSNKPVEAERPSRKSEAGDKPRRAETAPNKKRLRNEKREDALGRLDTRTERPSRGGDRPDRPARRGDTGGDAPRQGGKRDGGAKPRFAPDGDKPLRSVRGGGREGGDDRKGKGRFDKEAGSDRPSSKPLGTGRRVANVWVAPGGRPVGPKKAAEEEVRASRAEKPKSHDPNRRMGPKKKGPGNKPSGDRAPANRGGRPTSRGPKKD
ncbi:pseudouridine synthase [Jiella marina]|uniref:pseudouridine synthase n=1 Tax=Jiella sp. LLJ827 TaxID=2917712 RepID=UPI0021011A5B|nr:pseudouridine synthase [Jiella sp. LLJ827]MCQ0989557.1 pseudouridine synthase [Jiella sp. LLJ827]